MKSKEQRYTELYEQVKSLVEVSETETRLAKLFPQTKFQVGSKGGKEIELLKKKNIGKKGKYHAVVKMKRSSVIKKKDAEQEGDTIESPINNTTMSPEESIRSMQDPMMVAQDLMSQGMSVEEIAQQLVSQGFPEDQVNQIVQQLQQG